MKNKLIILIIILAGVLRFNQLNNLPALNADEAAIGYNAYSLLQTGKDEHGHSWPIHFQSFNDYKPGLYFYLVLPFVKLLGLNELSVRLPGAALGVTIVFVVWLLVRELFPRIKWFPEAAALFLAISPWHIHFSRGGWEVNTATFLITTGLYFFLRGLRSLKLLYLASAFFVASLYTYHSARVVVPLLVLGLVFVYRRIILKQVKSYVLLVGLSLLLLLPLVNDLRGPAGISRAAGVGLFADTGPFWRINQQRGEHSNFQGLLSKIFHNKPVNYSLAFLENYTQHFWGEFLFLSGDDIQRDKVPEMGQMYLLDLVFLIVGFIAVARSPSGWGVIILWLLVAPTAAALTFQSPHALRAQNMVIPLVVISAYGALTLFGWVGGMFHGRLRVTCYLLLVTIYFWDFSRYLHQYYFHMAKTYDYSSQYGVKELMQYVGENQEKYPRILITDRYDQPYILFLFYNQYPPAKFQNNHMLTARDQFGFSTVRSFDKYLFNPVGTWDKTRMDLPRALIAGAPDEIPDGANVLKTIYFPSGRIAFKVVAN